MIAWLACYQGVGVAVGPLDHQEQPAARPVRWWMQVVWLGLKVMTNLAHDLVPDLGRTWVLALELVSLLVR